MSDYLVIVESPAKAKTIGKFLGKNYKIEASMGHLRDLPKSKLGVDLENNFDPKYINIRGKGDLISNLRKAAKKAKKVLLATDPDREGEAISWHLCHILKLDENDLCRISFNEITKTAIKSAVKSPRQIDFTLVDAQQARRVLDRIVGYQISPLLWKKVKKGLSAGRVQSVTTKLICDREEEIQNFKSEEYWSLEVELSKGKESFISKYYGKDGKKIEIKSKEEADDILEEIKNEDFIVKNVKKGQKKKSPPGPFTTSTMQQESVKKLGYNTRKAMSVAQQLYEGISIKGHGTVGLVTYIRTDSQRVSQEAIETGREYIKNKYGEEFLTQTPREFKSKGKSQDAHEAIRPTYIELTPYEIKESLSNDQFKLYKLIWERFIASQMENALYDTVSADIEVNKHNFKASGNKLVFQGYLALDATDRETNFKIPELKKDDKLKSGKFDPKQHYTQPPARFTEASLVKMLEEKGIGRPSTYAPTIYTIQTRGYVEKQQKMLFPTELGKIVNDIMKTHFKDIVDEKFTANIEQKLDDIEEGNKKWKEMIGDFYEPFKYVLKDAEEKIGDVELKDEVTELLCEKCGRNMVIKLNRRGRKFLACPGFPECRNAKAILEEAGVDCPKCGKKVMIKKTKKGRNYLGCEDNPQCDFMSWDKPAKQDCPKCSKFLLLQTKKKQKFVKCSNEACDYENEIIEE